MDYSILYDPDSGFAVSGPEGIFEYGRDEERAIQDAYDLQIALDAMRLGLSLPH